MKEAVAAFLLCVYVSLGIYLRYIPFAPLLSTARKKLLICIYLAVTAVNYAIIHAGLYYAGANFGFNYLRFGGIIFSCILTGINLLILREKLQAQLFVFGVVLLCNYLLMAIPNYVITFIPQNSNIEYLLVILGIYSATLIVADLPLKYMLTQTITPYLDTTTDGYWRTIWFIPIAFFGTKFLSLGGEHNTGGIMQLISSLLYILVIVLLCINITAEHKRMQRSHHMEQQLEHQKLHYTELKLRVENARKLNHNLKHHIAAIRGFLDNDDKDGIVRYCDSLSARIDSSSDVPYTGNTAADGVLYHYIQQARQSRIDFKLTGSIHSPGIADIDLCAALGNALDNAVAGCMQVEDNRHIALLCQSEPSLLTIVVRNSFDGKVLTDQNGILSRKRQDRPGVGLTSMEAFCQRYGGSFQKTWDENTFTVMFMLPLASE